MNWSATMLAAWVSGLVIADRESAQAAIPPQHETYRNWSRDAILAAWLPGLAVGQDTN